jgi:succinoglycan biosynthesis transport protein ExoP
MLSQSQQSMSARDVCRIFFRHRRRSLLVFVAIVALPVVGVLITPRKYVSEAKFFVKVNLRFDPATTGEGSTVPFNLEREGEVRSIVALLDSRRLFEDVVDELGTDVIFENDLKSSLLDVVSMNLTSLLPSIRSENPKEQREKAIRKLEGEIEIVNPKKSHVVTVAYKSRSPERAQKVLDAYANAALEQHIEVNQNPESYEFFVAQEKLLKEQVLTARQAVRDVKNKVGLVSVESQRKVLEEHITNLDRELLGTDTTLASTKDRIETLRGQLPFELQNPSAGSALSTRSIDEMRNQLFTLEIRYRDLLSRYRESHPHVIALSEQVKEARMVLNQQQLANEMSAAKSLNSKRVALQDDFDATQKRLISLNEGEVHIAELQRQAEERTESHRVYVKKLEQARLDQQLESDNISNLRLSQAPTYMGKSLSRKGLVITALAAFVGLFGALAVAYASEMLDESLVTPADLETNLDVPVLMSLPHTRSHRISLN